MAETVESKSPLSGARETVEKLTKQAEPVVRQAEKDVDAVLSGPARTVADGVDDASLHAREKLEEMANEAGKKSGDEPTPTDFTGKTQQQRSRVSPGVMPLQHDSWFLAQDYKRGVHFQAHPGNTVIPHYSSKGCMEHIATAIKNTQKSICIITWGIDTDLRLTHAGSNNEYYRTLKYVGFEPAAQAPDHKDIYGKIKHAATPDPNSTVLADLLVSAAKRGVKVRLLVWEPAIANNVIDPLHLWWRSKTGIVKNMEFAFRAYEGEKMPKPSKVYLQGGDTGKTKQLAEANQRLQEVLDTATSDKMNAVYNMLLYTHHQKEILIDIDLPDRAVGFITGFNLKEEYWDSSAHAPYDDCRLPYAPWQDLGVEVRGPILHDMAQNFLESWSQMRMEDERVATTTTMLAKKLVTFLPWSTPEDAAALEEARQRWKAQADLGMTRIARPLLDLTNEVYPEHLIGAALAAGLGNNVDGGIYNKGVLNRFDAESYKALIDEGALELGTAEQWDYKLAPQCMELCHYLTTLSVIFYGLMTKSFVGDGMLRPAKAWDVSIPDEKAFTPTSDATKHTAQFFRTFPLVGKPKEVSIFQAYINAIRKVQDGQLIYIENQYFRDEYIVGEIILRHDQGIDFTVIVVANPLTDENGKFLTAETVPGEGPMKLCMERLKESGVKCRVCWLRVKEQTVPEYDSPRKMPMLGYLVGLLVKADLISEVDWSQRFDIAIRCRNHLLDKCYPLFGEMKTDATGKPLLEQIDDSYNPSIQASVKDYQAIRAALEKLKPKLQSIETIRDALQRAQGDMTVAVFNNTAQAYAQELDAALKEMVKVVNIITENSKNAVVRQRVGLAWERWNYNFRDFISGPLWDFRTAPSKPEPYIKKDKYYALVQREMERYLPYKKPAAEKSRFGAMTGHIYVHSKLMIVDGNYAITGSANINERSMWHDTEVAMGFRASAGGSVPRQMLERLCQSHFGMAPPEGREAFDEFVQEVQTNDSIYNHGNPTDTLNMNALTLKMREEAWAAPGSLG